jgi:hypothetical protein
MEGSAAATSSAGATRLLSRYGNLAPLLAGLGLLLLIAAHVPMQRQQFGLLSGLGLALGLMLWAAALVIGPRPAIEPRPLPALRTAPQTIDWTLVALALALAGLTWRMTGGGLYTLANVTSWIAATALWCWGWLPARDRSAEATDAQLDRRWLVALGAIVLLGAFFRFYRLTETPADPTSDHAEKLLDIYDLVNGQRPLFFPRNTGREPGQFYLTFALMKLFNLPLRFETLKLGTALIGLLAVPAVFLFGREVGGTRVGLIAAALYAISKWVVNTARMGLRFPYGPLPTALTLWLLLRYLRRGDRRDALLCGLTIGLGLHGYISFRVVPLVVPFLLGAALLFDRRWRHAWRRLLGDGLLIAATALLTCLPLAHYSVQHPEQVWYRVATRASAAERTLGSTLEQLGTFARNNLNAALAFNWRGDDTVVNAVHHDPFLDIVTGAALLAGLLIAVVRIRRGDRALLWLLLPTPLLLLPSTLSLAFPIENPSANRLGPVAPAIFVLAALPCVWLLDQVWSRRAERLILLGGLSVLFALATQQNYVRYFRDYDQQYRANVQNMHQVVRSIEGLVGQGVPLDQVYILAYPYWLDGRNIALAMGKPGWEAGHDWPREQALPERAATPMLFVLNAADDRRRAELSSAFPDGSYSLITDTPLGKEYGLYYVPAR